MIINRSRSSVLISLFLVLVVSGASAFQGIKGNPLAVGEERSILRNEYGSVIRDSKGERINYSREEIEAQRAKAQTTDSPTPPPVRDVLPASGPDASWSYATFGSGIGISNIIAAQNGAHREIYSAGGFNSYWIALRFDSSTHDYDQIYVSPFFTETLISRIKVANVVGDSGKEIIVVLQNGQIVLYDQATKALLNTTSTSASNVTGLDVADVDGDSANDLVLCTENHIYVYSGTGVLKWELSGAGGRDLIVGQMDADSALEIAVTDGNVVDCATHLSQWTWQNHFGARLGAADIDGDGMKELIVAEQWQFVWAYDVDRKLPKWSISFSHDIGAMLVADVDGDSAPEVLVGQGQWGSVLAYDPVTQQQKWTVQNPEHGITNLAVGDVDGDAALELLWGAGASSSGEDHLYVANWQTGLIEWQNIHLDGPFVGPEIGDLDGDGRAEMVVISWSSDSGYSSGRILVFDAITRKLRAMSGPTMAGGGWTGIHDLKLRDVKGDARKEILVAASFTYDGIIEIYSFDSSNSFSLDWTNATQPFGAPFYSVDAADIDGDGEMEIVGGVGAAHSGATGIFIYVYNYNTRNEEWHSLHMGWGAITDLDLADVNNDGTKEIIGMVNDHDVYIFDGPTKLLETILFGPFSAMRVQSVGGLPSIVLGNNLGDVMMYRFSSGSYGQTYNQRLVNKPIDGFTIDSQERVWIGTPGTQFNSPATLTEVNLAGTVLAAYSGYGSTLGLQTAFVPASLSLFTTGSYSVLGFPTCTASLSSSNQAFPSAGGTGSVNVIADGTCNWAAQSDAAWITITSGGGTGNGAANYSVSANSGPARSGTITIAGNTFTITQGDGRTDTIGLFRPSGNFFFLRNFNSFGTPDVIVPYGAPGDLPIVGDWDGDGDVTIGLYRPSSSTFFLRNTNSLGPPDLTITYGDGPGGDLPIAGDWNGDGTWTIGVYRPATSTFFLRNSNSFGIPDIVVVFGAPGDMPLAGDWDGNGTMTIGLFRPSGNFFFLRNVNAASPPDVTVAFGAPGDLPIVGDWDGDGTTTIGLFRPSGNFFFLRNTNSLGTPNIIFTFGAPGDKPLVGDWDGM